MNSSFSAAPAQTWTLPTDLFQRHLEETFGPPTLTSPSSEGYLSHTWTFPGVEILHYVQEHFGPAEYVRIRKTAELPGSRR